MPKINLIEKDLTTPGRLSNSSNIVYVPGFYKKSKSEEANINGQHITDGLYLFNSVSEFKAFFTYKEGDGSYKFKYLSTSEDGVNFNTPERSMVYALALLQIGLPILFDAVGIDADTLKEHGDKSGKITHNNLKAYFDSIITEKLQKLTDKNNYDIKFITTGGYENLNNGAAHTMIKIATKRGDCTALVDHDEKTNGSYKYVINNETPKSGFGAMFTPWCNFKFPSHDIGFKEIELNMPGSLAYLLAFGTSIANGNANWLAAAGATRGYIPYLKTPLIYLTEAEIENYQKRTDVSVNPIAKINPYGVIIWGNRTLNNNVSGLVASSFLNIRQLCNDIKKTLYIACKNITFEPNSDFLWIKFKSMITPLLDQMQTGDGISGYTITKKKSVEKATLTAVIRIYPIEAVEDFEITLELADDFTNVTDNL